MKLKKTLLNVLDTYFPVTVVSFIRRVWRYSPFGATLRILKTLRTRSIDRLEYYLLHFSQGLRHRIAGQVLKWAAKRGLFKAERCFRLALIYLARGGEQQGAAWLNEAANQDPFYWNCDLDIARNSIADIPPSVKPDLDGLLYAGYNIAAMHAFSKGLKSATALAAAAADKQEKLKPRAFPSAEIAAFFVENKLRFDDIQILPMIWITQIGHIGMLDLMFRMRRLGWWKGEAIVLAPEQLVANQFFLSLVCEHYDVLMVQDTLPTTRLRDFVSLARSHGRPYHVFQPPGMPYVRWHEAAALAMLHQHDDEPSWTLASSFDKRYEKDVELNAQFRAAMSAWGIGEGDWFVCLHLRELGYHSAEVDSGQGNRNSQLANYLGAIQFIVSRGGHVIKMGSSNSPVPPEIPGLIDYPHSVFKSEALDIALIRNARYFIGTTSGLANVAISLGIPTAQVNCITTEYQPWSSLVRFCPKIIRRKEGEMLTQRELTSDDRWSLATTHTMSASGLTAEDNTQDEILAAVQEIDALASGLQAEPDPILAVWRSRLAAAHAYGAALPCVYFLHKHAAEFLSENFELAV